MISAKLAGIGLTPGSTGSLEQDVVVSVSAFEELPVAARVVQRVAVVLFPYRFARRKDRFVWNLVPESTIVPQMPALQTGLSTVPAVAPVGPGMRESM